jgi:hypothetical protein
VGNQGGVSPKAGTRESHGRAWPGSGAHSTLGVVLRRALIGLLIALAAAGPAAAGQIVGKLGLRSGKLVLTAKATHVAAGAAVSIPLRIADGRGTGAGWTLRLRDASGLKVTAIKALCAAGSTCTLPSAVGAPHDALILRSAQATGMGVIRVVVTVHASTIATVAFRLLANR